MDATEIRDIVSKVPLRALNLLAALSALAARSFAEEVVA